MKNVVIYIICLFAFFSCVEKIKDSSNLSSSTHDTTSISTKKEVATNSISIIDKPMANPQLMYGSDFLHLFQEYYKIGNFDEMMKLTSKQSIVKYGHDHLEGFYQDMKFGFLIKGIKSIKKTSDSTYTLSYETSRIATKGIVRVNLVIENDTCKIILPEKNLNNFLE